MSPPPKTGSLARRLLVIFVVVALLPLAATVALSYWSSRDVVAGLLEENLGKTARLYASEVDDFLAEKTELLAALAGGIAAKDAVLAEVVARSEIVEELIVIDANGNLEAHSQRGAGWAIDTCRSGEPGLTPMIHAQHGQGHEVVVSVERADGGRLCGRVSFTLHQDMISERARSTFGGLAYIVDRSGNVVCHAFEESEPHIHPGQPILGPAAEHAKTGVPWHGVVKIDGARHLAAFAPATNLPWGVWAEVPLTEASDVLRPLTTRALLMGAMLTGLLSLVTFVLVRRIAAPIEQLAAASQRIAAGAIGETVPERGNDEIGMLAREFNTMSRALAESLRDLDAKVEVRTQELDEARRFSDTLLDTVEQRIFVIDRDLTVIRANHAATEAYGPEIVGCGCRDVHGTSSEGACPAEEVFDTNQRTVAERLRRLPDGRTEILSVERYPVPGPNGPRAVLEIERDVTELKQFQAHLVHQEKMAALGTLAAGLAHEIGNPLASLSSELQLLAMEPEGARKALPILQDQVRRMGGLLRELVDLGRAPADLRERFRATDVVDDVLRLVRHGARDQGVELVKIEPTEPLWICSSRDRLVQVLLNLALNAVDALQVGGCVTFAVQAAGDGLRFVVSDDGPGLPEQREQLFEPFFTTKPVGEGTGLGLFVVDRIVNALSGTVTAENGPDGGAIFTVAFPDCSCGDEHE